MPATPSADTIRSRNWQIGLAAVLLAILLAFAYVIIELVTLWVTKADYSHGLLVAGFAGYLLWTRRAMIPAKFLWPDLWGLPLFAISAAMYFVAERTNFAKEGVQALALVVALMGVVVMFCGRWKGLLWAWPSLAFLPLAFPLPFRVEQEISFKLRAIATDGGNFAFQTFGLASYTEGNVIVIGETRLGVEKACSGLSMLLAFLALSAGIALAYRSRPLMDRIIVLLSAVPIALVCNVIRIVVTGLVYHAGWTQLGDAIVHDLAGWLMMPLALGFTWLELKIIGWILEPIEAVSTAQALNLPTRRPGTVQ